MAHCKGECAQWEKTGSGKSRHRRDVEEKLVESDQDVVRGGWGQIFHPRGLWQTFVEGKVDGEIDSFCNRINMDLICIWIPLAIGGIVCGDDDVSLLVGAWPLPPAVGRFSCSWGASEDVKLSPDQTLDWICVIHVLFYWKAVLETECRTGISKLAKRCLLEFHEVKTVFSYLGGLGSRSLTGSGSRVQGVMGLPHSLKD